jgi:methyltransferase (TIGR00027 family)
MNIRFVKEDHESNTAGFMALFRAVESTGSRQPQLFSDPLAAGLLPPTLRVVARLARVPVVGRVIPSIIDAGWPRTRSSGVVRTRFIDGLVANAIELGATQLVLLGAGYDSRAWRLSETRSIAVFEVDHPATQGAKRARLEALGAPAGRVSFVAVDFERDDVASRLADAGFDYKAKSVVLWEGVVSYLNAVSVDRNFDLLSHLCSPGSELIFTYVDARALDGSIEFDEARRWKSWVRFNGEPFIFGFHPDETAAYLGRRGFHLDSDLTTAQVAQDYATSLGRIELGSDLYRVAVATRTASCPV